MSRLGVPNTLSHRDRSSLYSNGGDPYSDSPYTSTPSHSGRSSPYPTANPNNTYNPTNGATRFAEDLEGQNDERLEGLTAKVKLLKDITKGIGNEVRESTVQLSQMNDAFAETSGILGGTFRRMNNMATKQGGRWACYMIFLFIVGWIFVLVWWIRRWV